MGAIATFDPAAWRAAYPAFGALTDAQATGLFTRACLYWPNNGAAPVPDVATQTTLLYLLTAHVAALSFKADGTAVDPGWPVGRISSATEGSVTVQTELPGDASMNEAWYLQTQYGLSFWQATAQFRTMKYRVAAASIAYSRFGFGRFNRFFRG